MSLCLKSTLTQLIRPDGLSMSVGILHSMRLPTALQTCEQPSAYTRLRRG